MVIVHCQFHDVIYYNDDVMYCNDDVMYYTDQQTTLQSLHQVTSQDIQTEESFGAAEKHFSFHSLEKILGLLACVIPTESTVSISNFVLDAICHSPLVVRLE